MLLDEPGWWYARQGRIAGPLLAPLAHIYGAMARRNYERAVPYRARVPVVCIGNFTAGGTGKTPLTLHLAHRLAASGHQPVALTRGYGGRLKGPYWVDAERDGPGDVGDEPLLLAGAVRTMLSRDRAAGARAIETGPHPASVILMDDGLQNGSLAKDLVIAVVDGRRGFGNGRVIPAGPLRAPLAFQMHLADVILVNEGPDSDGTVAEGLRRAFTGAVLRATTAPAGDIAWVTETPLLAWAGIGGPERFFRLLDSLGGDVRIRRCFPDHHMLTETEAAELLQAALASGTRLVTTAKDRARLTRRGGAAAELARESRVLEVGLTFSQGDADRLDEIVISALAARRG